MRLKFKIIKSGFRKIIMLFALLIVSNFIAVKIFAQQTSNDHIFSASDKAKPFIDFDNKGFIINGKRTFIVSAGMEYARVPRELWYDRLLRLKRAGFNCIEIYTFWNYHEQEEGKFNFSGDHDLNFFLQLLKKMGMYCIARVGPYYCAEWDNGGYPLWLRFKPGVRVREDNAEFEKYTDRFFDKLMPVISNNQINHGGSVIMVQLENEHNDGWGTVMPNNYFRHLREKALSLGLEVPYFFSGLHHESDPAEDRKLDDSTRPNPWMSTEFWSVWFTGYSSSVKDAREYAWRTWKIIANGGNGYNYYMAHGGSNFAYTNNDEDAASYDYGAAVGQGGDLRPIYYSFKRAAFFSKSFQDILENSTDASGNYKNFISDATLHVTARKSPAGEIIFLENPKDTAVLTAMVKRKEEQSINDSFFSLQPKEILPIIHHYKINESVTLQWAPVKILSISKQENTTTIIIYGEESLPAEMYFTISRKALITKGVNSLSAHSNTVKLNTKFTADNKPAEYSFSAGTKKIRILCMNEQLADRTWIIEGEKHPYIICGPDYIGEIKSNNDHISIKTESPLEKKNNFPVWIYTAQNAKQLFNKKHVEPDQKKQLILANWQMKNASQEADPNYKDHAWKASDTPLQMGADGDTTADAWYRTTINIDTAGKYTLLAEGGDRATLFIDGKVASTDSIKKGEMTFDVEKGKHTLAIFTAHDGRDKLAGYVGAMADVDRKGLFGNALLIKGGPSISELNNWRFLKATNADDIKKNIPSSTIEGWENYIIGKDAFDGKKGFGWFQTTFPEPTKNVLQTILNFKSVDENATVFINDKQIIKHVGWNSPFNALIEHIDTFKKPIVLTVFIENYSNEGGIDKPVHINYIPASMQLTDWRMRGGINDPEKINDWQMDDAKAKEGKPYFFKTQFTLSNDSMPGTHFIWRVITQDLGHGSVWVNGYNLGRYPEKIPINGLYIPECWMKGGKNSLIIFDEDGKLPTHVSVEAEIAASRYLKIFTDY